MDLINKNKAIVTSVHGDILTIRHRRGGTSKVTVDRGLRYTIGELVCYTVDPVNQQITGILPKKQADAIVEKASSIEAQVAVMGIPDGFQLEDDADDEEIDPIDRYYGEDDYGYNAFSSEGQVTQNYIDNCGGEYREPLRDEADYFGLPLED